MNGKFAWPSVAVYRGGTFSRRSIIKCDTDENFGALMERLEVNLGSKTVAEVTISAVADDKSVHSAHTVPLDAPVTLLWLSLCQFLPCNIIIHHLTSTTAAAKCTRNVDAEC